MKLKAQFPDVDSAFAGARIRRGTISAGYNQVMPSHPTAKKELNRKRKRAAMIPEFLVDIFVMMVRIIYTIGLISCKKAAARVVRRGGGTMQNDMPAEPNSISCRRPNFSMVKTAIQDAMKYSDNYSG